MEILYIWLMIFNFEFCMFQIWMLEFLRMVNGKKTDGWKFWKNVHGGIVLNFGSLKDQFYFQEFNEWFCSKNENFFQCGFKNVQKLTLLTKLRQQNGLNWMNNCGIPTWTTTNCRLILSMLCLATWFKTIVGRII